MREALREIKELEELLLQCMKCGFCQGVCPVYQVEALEPSVARGKLALLEAVHEGRLQEVGRILRHVENCLLCRRCAHNCPSGVETDLIFFKAREILRKVEGLPWYQRMALSLALRHSGFMGWFTSWGGRFLKLTGKRVAQDVYKPPFLERFLVRPASRPFTSRRGGWHRASPEKDRVIFYPGCAVNYIYDWWGDLLLEYLVNRSISVWVPSENVCCGVPAGSMGDGELFREMVRKNWEIMGEVEASFVVTLCPTCLYGLGEMGPRLAGVEPVRPVLDLLQLIARWDLGGGGRLEEGPVTYHVPCHYPDGAFMVEALKGLLPGEWVDLEAQGCCGFGGTFSLKHFGTSMDILAPKVLEVRERGVERVFTCCPGCALHITQGLVEEGVASRVYHPLEVLVRR